MPALSLDYIYFRTILYLTHKNVITCYDLSLSFIDLCVQTLRVFNIGSRALARDPSTRHLDGLFHLWTGKKNLKKLKHFLVCFEVFYQYLHFFFKFWATIVNNRAKKLSFGLQIT